jgi:hypothetical protein
MKSEKWSIVESWTTLTFFPKLLVCCSLYITLNNPIDFLIEILRIFRQAYFPRWRKMALGQTNFWHFFASSFPGGYRLAPLIILADISGIPPSLQDNKRTVELEGRFEEAENPFHYLFPFFAPLIKPRPLNTSSYLNNSGKRLNELHWRWLAQLFFPRCFQGNEKWEVVKRRKLDYLPKIWYFAALWGPESYKTKFKRITGPYLRVSPQRKWEFVKIRLKKAIFCHLSAPPQPRKLSDLFTWDILSRVFSWEAFRSLLEMDLINRASLLSSRRLFQGSITENPHSKADFF